MKTVPSPLPHSEFSRNQSPNYVGNKTDHKPINVWIFKSQQKIVFELGFLEFFAHPKILSESYPTNNSNTKEKVGVMRSVFPWIPPLTSFHQLGYPIHWGPFHICFWAQNAIKLSPPNGIPKSYFPSKTFFFFNKFPNTTIIRNEETEGKYPRIYLNCMAVKTSINAIK